MKMCIVFLLFLHLVVVKMQEEEFQAHGPLEFHDMAMKVHEFHP